MNLILTLIGSLAWLYCVATVYELLYLIVHLIRHKDVDYTFTIGRFYYHVEMKHYKDEGTGKQMVDYEREAGFIDIHF